MQPSEHEVKVLVVVDSTVTMGTTTGTSVVEYETPGEANVSHCIMDRKLRAALERDVGTLVYLREEKNCPKL